MIDLREASSTYFCVSHDGIVAELRDFIEDVSGGCFPTENVAIRRGLKRQSEAFFLSFAFRFAHSTCTLFPNVDDMQARAIQTSIGTQSNWFCNGIIYYSLDGFIRFENQNVPLL
mmetsp:Transcript_10628/g.26657  ORF Transcript_10628/g.26657 Transcript_10628/m.26657 type:complete len:115 (-) Transcript_10628:247-591(-)